MYLILASLNFVNALLKYSIGLSINQCNFYFIGQTVNAICFGGVPQHQLDFKSGSCSGQSGEGASDTARERL